MPTNSSIKQNTPKNLAAGAAVCHAISHRLPLGLPPEDAVRRIESALRAHNLQTVSTFIERHACGADSSVAATLRQRELSLPPLAKAGRCLRAHILVWEDGQAELCLVAFQDVMSVAALQALAMEICFAGHADPLPALSPCVGALDADLLPEAEWGLGGVSPRSGRLRAGSVGFEAGIDLPIRLAALGLALARFESRRRVVLVLYGHPAFEQAHIGNFVGRMRPIVVDLDAGPNSDALIEQVRSGLVDGPSLAVADCLKEKLVGVSGPFLHQLTAETHYVGHLQAPFAMTIAISAEADNAQPCEVDVDTAHYSPEVAHQFVRVACGMAQCLDAARRRGAAIPVDAIEWLLPEHAAEIVALGRAAALPADARRERIEQRIARHASLHPTQIAVTCEGRQMDFATLTDTAARIATVLAGLGVREGDFIGVLMERCLDIVPVLLGVLRCGAAYVPVDPAYPAERIVYTLSDAAPSVVIGTRPEGADGVWIEASELLARASEAEPCKEFAGGAEAAAYVIYTSGSTGRPKGVVVPHRNVCALIDATQGDFGYGADDTWTLFHSTAFDFSVWEIWACLGSGGRLVVVPFWVTRSTDDFRKLLESERVTVLNQTPSAFAQLIDSECRRKETPALTLRLVVFGGEPLDCRMLARWFDRYPESACRLVNMFGITETTVHVTAETLTRSHVLNHSRAVGPAIPGWNLYVLDETQRLMPPGVAGEIYVAGEGVAREYLGRADLTEQRFINDPFSGGRMYRSGDRGRLRPDGRLEHLGRLDSQVKIRGFRIELDEIRAVLLNCPGVQSAAVLVSRADPDDAASARLDAYVVMSEGSTLDVKQHAARVLPSYMTPSTYTALSALPLTSNGKLDAKRLPLPQLSTASMVPKAPVAAASSEALAAVDCSPLENKLLEVWMEVLGVKVSLDDNFFDLGGNSLYAVRLVAAMRRRSMVPLAVRELYLHQTVRKVALAISPANQEETIA